LWGGSAGDGSGRCADFSTDHCRILRIDLATHDRRIFMPHTLGMGSPSWRRSYRRRSVMERINSRLDNSFNFETNYIRSRAKMKIRVGLAVAVMTALALAHVRVGCPERMHSLVNAVPWLDAGLSLRSPPDSPAQPSCLTAEEKPCSGGRSCSGNDPVWLRKSASYRPARREGR